MKLIPLIAITLTAFISCETKKETAPATTASPLSGTWKLLNAKSVEKNDTVDTSPKAGQETIKMFNDTRFAFFSHDLNHGKDSATATYNSGSGTYTLTGDAYTEHLEYCSAREWENKDFNFKMQVSGDTIVQRGVERIDSLNIDHEIIETYVRVR